MGSAVSQQARRRKRVREWRERVHNEARRRWPVGEQATSSLVMVTIWYFYIGTPMDVDNIPKPIIDAIKELVIGDDAQVTDLTCRKRYLGDDLRIENHSGILSEGLSQGEPFVYVVVEEAPNQEVIE